VQLDAGMRRPTLDDVFLQLTGHRAADDDAAGDHGSPDDDPAGGRGRGRRGAKKREARA
jgi:ABC-2 type transport system ATP-binding protein